MQPLISVIVPIYNVELFLNDCIESILAQTYKNLEILLIDDGSTDGCNKICDKFGADDSRIKVVHKQNSGVSETRNLGLSLSRGEFYCFIDGDDTVHPEYVDHLYHTIEKFDADISTCAYLYKWQDGTTKRTKNGEFSDNYIDCDSGEDALISMLYSKKHVPSCCSKLYRKSSMGLIQFSHYATGEDMLASVDYYMKSKKVAYTNQPFYYYMQNASSVMHTFNPEKIYDTVITADEMMKKVHQYPSIIKSASYYVIEKNLIVFMKLYKHEGTQDKIKHIKNNIKRYRKTVITDSNAEMRTRIACLISYLGFSTLYKIRNLTSK